MSCADWEESDSDDNGAPKPIDFSQRVIAFKEKIRSRPLRYLNNNNNSNKENNNSNSNIHHITESVTKSPSIDINDNDNNSNNNININNININNSINDNINNNTTKDYGFYYSLYESKECNICTKTDCIVTDANENKISIKKNHPGLIVFENNKFYVRFGGMNGLYLVDSQFIEQC